MAQAITIKVSLDTGDIRQGAQQIERQVKGAVDGAVRQAEAGGRKIGSALSAGISSALKGAGNALTVGLSLPLVSLGAVAVKAAKDLDVTRQQLAALTGSAEAANRKLVELRKLAQESPGVTSRFAQQAFAQLKAVGSIADETINRVIKSVGRLNAVFTIGDVDGFLRNIVQIFNQGFERADIKEALGRVPIFEQLLEQAFGTKDPDKLRQMKEAGKLTLNQWLTGLSEGIDSDRRFASVEDNIASRFEKIRERSLEALAPLGEAIIRDVLPVIEKLIPKIIELLDAFAKLPPGVQENIVKFGLFAIAIGPVVRGIGGLIGLVGSLTGKLVGSGGLSAALTATAVKLATFLNIAGPLGLLPIAGLAGFGAAKIDLDQRLAASDPATRFNAEQAQREAIRRNRFGGPAIQLPRIENGAVVIDGAFSSLPQDVIDRIQSTGEFRGDGGGGGGGTKAARDKALREQKEFIEATRSLQLEQLRQAEEIAKQNRDNQLAILQSQYDQGLVSTNEFYAAKLAAQERGIQAELNLLQVEATQLEAARDVAKGAEKIKIEEQLVKLYAEQQIKVLGLTALLNRNFEEYKKVLGGLNPNLDLSQQEQVQGEFVTDAQRRARQALEEAAQAKQDFQREDLRLAIEEQRIQNAINAGVLTEAEGRQALLAAQRASRDELIAYLEIQKNVATGFEADKIQLQIEQLRNLGVELTSTQRFLRGLGSETETLGDIWERFGQNVARSFNNIKDVFNGLKNAVKQFFADILGNSLRNLLRGTLGALFGGGGGQGGGGGFGGGNQGGGLIGGVIQQALGGVFGGSLFGTSGRTSAAGGGGGLNFFGGGGSSPITGGLNAFLTGGFAGGGGAADALRIGANTAGGGFGAPGGGILNRLFGNLLGINPGTGGFLASAGPVLAGIGLGAGLGGQSVLGQILGGIGGGAVGLGLSFGAAVFGAGGGLGAAALAALGPAALIGAPLLIGAILLGRAKQRKKDEEQSGVWLTDAISGIQQIKAGVQGGSIDPNQARSIFENQVLATFIQQINTLKTKSVRESRLTNQVRDLRNLFDKEVGPAIDAAKKATVVNRNIIPEFHTGGLAANETLAVLQRGEMVLTAAHQNRINAMMPGVFEAVGVPNAPNQSGTYHSGGRVSQGVGSGDMNVDVTVVMGTQDQTLVFVNGVQTEAGRKALARSIGRNRLDGVR